MAVKNADTGYFVDRPTISSRIDDAIPAGTGLAVTIPVRLNKIAYQLPLGMAAHLILALWLDLRNSVNRMHGRRPATARGNPRG